MKKHQREVLVDLGILIFVAIVILCAIRYFKPKPKAAIQAPAIVQDTNASFVKTYTSKNLGVEFNYLNDGGFGSDYQVIPSEAGNKITLGLIINGKPETGTSEDSISVFKGLATQTAAQILKVGDPADFKNQNCEAVAYPANSKSSYLIWDKRIPTTYFRSTSLDGTKYQDLKNPCLGEFEYYTDAAFPGVVYTMTYPTQAEDYYADLAHAKFWYETVHLIAK